MRLIATILCAAVMLPSLAASPTETAEKIPGKLPTTIDLSVSGSLWKETLQRRAAERLVTRAAQSKCYFIRQLNTDLKAPEANPRMIPLEGASTTLVTDGKSTCVTASLVREAAAR